METWYGPTIGETLVESKGPLGQDIGSLLRLAPGVTASRLARVESPVTSGGRSHGISVHVVRNRITQTCGKPAIEAFVSLKTQVLKLQSYVLVDQAVHASYSLEYFDQSDVQPSSTLLAAMHDFCPS